MPSKKELAGMRFDRLLVLSEVGREQNRVTWSCKCDCGNEIVVRGDYLCQGHRRACRACQPRRSGRSEWGGGGLKAMTKWLSSQSGGECWPWPGHRGKHGYGSVGIGKRIFRAHRVVWEMFNGPIPKGLFACHRCDNPPCVNPAHLFLGTNTDNMRDMIAKGRAAWQRKSRP